MSCELPTGSGKLAIKIIANSGVEERLLALDDELNYRIGFYPPRPRNIIVKKRRHKSAASSRIIMLEFSDPLLSLH